MSLRVGVLVFPGITQLDAAGPCELFASLPETEVCLIGASRAPIATGYGLAFHPASTYADAPELDVLCVPGGFGVNALMEDEACLEFLRRRAPTARFVTSVCTGALVLGAAGLLRGYRATTHWLSLEFLAAFGAVPSGERVVVDRNRITGGGVTAGIDLALAVAAELAGETAAKKSQLYLEYAPAPPFACGSPDTAPVELVEAVRADARERQDARRAVVERAAGRLRDAAR
ncbi:MAG TPA: DJ-1/PfpI family protein [Polyangiaceae bacterium]